MATSLSSLYTIATTLANLQVGRMAMIQVSLTIASEAVDNIHPVKHLKRHTLATNVLNDPDYWTPRFVQAAIALDQASGYGTDALIIQAITTVFDKIAGVDAAD